jgi:hypothetical protein
MISTNIVFFVALVAAAIGTYAQETSAATPPYSTNTAAPRTSSARNQESPAEIDDVGTVTITNDDPSIIYSSGGRNNVNWNFFFPCPENFSGKEHSSNFVRSTGQLNTSAVVNFYGTAITWIGKKGPNYGFASYSIDGGPPTIVNNFSSREVDRNPNAIVSGLSIGPHVLAITLLDQTEGTDYWQTIDAFTTDGRFLSVDQGSSAGYNSSSELVFSGTWGSGPSDDGSNLSGGHYWSKEPDASISWTFQDKSVVEVYGRPDYEDGYMDVFLDGHFVSRVDGFWGYIDDDSLNSCLLYAGRVSPERHTITVRVTGAKNAQARDAYVQVDQFVAF